MVKVIEESKEQITIECAYCGGGGMDPFELLSKWATCYVCRGRLQVRVRRPIRRCPYCEGSGISPRGRYSCIVCRGKGVIHVKEQYMLCHQCSGSGSSSGLWCVECGGKGVTPRVYE